MALKGFRLTSAIFLDLLATFKPITVLGQKLGSHVQEFP